MKRHNRLFRQSPQSKETDDMSDTSLDRAAVDKVLAGFQDPESGRNVLETTQARDIELSGDQLSLTLQLTTHSKPLWKETRESLIAALREGVPGVGEVSVELAEHTRPAIKLGEVGLAAKSVIAVGSGKGGVGKSTIATSIALGLSGAGCKVGLLDADVYGPSIPHLLGVQDGERPEVIDNKIQPPVRCGLAIMSMGLLVPPGEAVVWRGPMLHGAMTQFLRDTNWGELDYLIIDMPPGTGDVALSLSQILPLTGAVIVCTPQDVALLDAVRAIAMFGKVNIPVLGMVENMSYFQCPDCDKRHDIFGSGGARRKADELDLTFLGDVPINIQIRINGDLGNSMANLDDAATAPYLQEICSNLARQVAKNTGEEPPLPTLSVMS